MLSRLSTLLWVWWSGICLENVVCSRTWIGLSCSFCSRMHHWILWCDTGCAIAFKTPDRMHWPTAKQVIKRNTMIISPCNRTWSQGLGLLKTRQWIQLGSPLSTTWLLLESKTSFGPPLLVMIFPNVRIASHKAYMNRESVILRVCVCVCVWERERERERVAQSCLTLCNPMDYSPGGSSVHGILQARILEWVAIPFSRGSSRPRDRTRVSCIAGRFFTIWATREALPGEFLKEIGLTVTG